MATSVLATLLPQVALRCDRIKKCVNPVVQWSINVGASGSLPINPSPIAEPIPHTLHVPPAAPGFIRDGFVGKKRNAGSSVNVLDNTECDLECPRLNIWVVHDAFEPIQFEAGKALGKVSVSSAGCLPPGFHRRTPLTSICA
jgi:hypothetical protein